MVQRQADIGDSKCDGQAAYFLNMMTLPKQYKVAIWRNTTAIDEKTKAIGIGFNFGRSMIRIKLDLKCAKALQETISESLKNYEAFQSAKFSEVSR
jgi:hypothetical protein